MSAFDYFMVRLTGKNFRGAKNNKRPARAGFYLDPQKEAPYRFWDGAAWTDQVSQTPVA